MYVVRIFNNIKASFTALITFKNASGKMRIESMIGIIVFLFLLSFYSFENVFQKSEGFFRLASLGIILTAFIMVVLYFRLLIRETDKKNKNILEKDQYNFIEDISYDLVEDGNYDLQENESTIEDNFKTLFREDICFMEFKEKAIKSGFIDHNYKWLFKEKEMLYFALLFYKLKENNYLKYKIENRFFCEVSSDLMGIKIDPSMLSKYNPHKENNKHIKVDHLKYYKEDYSVFC